MENQPENTKEQLEENTKEQISEENSENKKQEPGFFQKYYLYIIFFIAFQIGLRFFNKNREDPNEPKFTCIFEEGTKFDVNFYLSSKDHYSVIRDSKPIYTIKDMKFSYENYSSNSFDNMINITYNVYLKIIDREIEETYSYEIIAEIDLVKGVKVRFGWEPRYGRIKYKNI